ENGTQPDPWFEAHPVETVFLRHKNTAVIDKNEPIVKIVSNCAKIIAGNDPLIAGATYGADMELFVNLGHIPTIMYGPGSIVHAHKPDEFIAIDEYMTSVKTLALSIYHWCQ
ncbi:MAG: M20/M25/M40 family metallo-hydrolase, partial [Desulfobacterales bacterium]